MLNLVVTGVVAEVLDGDAAGVGEVGHGEALLDESLCRFRRGERISGDGAVDEVDIVLGEEIERSDERLGLHRREARPRETVRQARRGERREKQKREKEEGGERERSLHCCEESES